MMVVRRKLTNSQIIDIANSYANGSDAIDTAYLSSKYGVSKSTISRYLHYAISNCLVSKNVAKQIAEKAVRHDTLKRKEFGYSKSDKVSKFYEKLLLSYDIRKNSMEELEHLQNEYDTYQNLLNTYDDTFSSSDEFPYTKEQLEDKVDKLLCQIQKINSTLK